MSAIAVQSDLSEYREYQIHYYEIQKSRAGLYLWDSVWHAVQELGPGFYSVVAYNIWGVPRLSEVRPAGVKLEVL